MPTVHCIMVAHDTGVGLTAPTREFDAPARSETEKAISVRVKPTS